MKYIKTKDGRIIETSTFEKYLTHPLEEPYVGDGIGMYAGVPIVKEADSIEELCDYLVASMPGRLPCVIGDIEAKEMCADKTVCIYGALWTDKGFIYVSKLSDKGEWELL